MTTLAFPDTTGQPTDGSFTYEENGVIYSWTGEYWAANNAQGFDQRYVNADGDTMTGDLTVPSLNGGPLAGFRNQIINGDFRVWQRGTSFNLPSGDNNNAYTADRWYTASGVQCRQFDANAPAGFTNCWNHQGGAGNVGQLIELDDTNGKQDRFAAGTTWTMSVWSTANLTDGNHNFTAQWVESPLANQIQIATGAWIPTGESSNGFNRYRFTFPINTAIGATQSALHVFWVFPGESAWYTGAQLEPGPVATPFEHRPIGTELAMCQRYYTSMIGATAYSAPANNMTFSTFITFPTTLRVSPSIELSGGSDSNVTDISAIGGVDKTGFVMGAKSVLSGYSSFSRNLAIDAEL